MDAPVVPAVDVAVCQAVAIFAVTAGVLDGGADEIAIACRSAVEA